MASIQAAAARKVFMMVTMMTLKVVLVNLDSIDNLLWMIILLSHLVMDVMRAGFLNWTLTLFRAVWDYLKT